MRVITVHNIVYRTKRFYGVQWNVVAMPIEIEGTERFLDDGDPIEEFYVSHSRFDRIAIKRSEDTIVVKASGGDGDVIEFEFELAERLYKGVTPRGQARRDVDDDIQDTLLVAGYAVTDLVEP